MVGATNEDILSTPPTSKVEIAARLSKAANPSGRFEGIFDNFAKQSVARRFTDCDFLFLAADSMQARLVFNAIVHQYLVPRDLTESTLATAKSPEYGHMNFPRKQPSAWRMK